LNIERSRKGRGLFYHRDSGGKHDQSLPEYVQWAVRRAAELGVEFDGTSTRIIEMVNNHTSVSGDLFLDYCVSGNQMSRTALDQLSSRINSDLKVSHLFIAKRERLSRPDDAFEAVLMEEGLREQGLTIVYQDKILPPLIAGQRRDLVERLTSFFEFDQSGRFRGELAMKMIHAHASLAKQGFSTGGRAPYGFRRWLVESSGRPMRILAAGEIVRMAGHHVRWLPGSDEEQGVLLRILDLIPNMAACRIAKILNAEGVPAPDCGRMRTDNGVKHLVSGLWNANSITNIAKKTLNVAETAYGQRSMGDQRRLSPTGPRELEVSDRRADGKPKVIQNPEELIIRGQSTFEPLIGLEKHKEILAILHKRGGTQRGKPRSRNPGQNPLGCRIFDMACSSVMYRTPFNGTFRYICGLYQKSHSQKCSYNHVDGITATRFALAAVQQQICSPAARRILEQKLRARAQAEISSDIEGQVLQTKRSELARIETNLKRAVRNLSLADDDFQFREISAVVKGMQAEKKACEQAISVQESQTKSKSNIEDEIATILNSMSQLQELASDSNNLPAIGSLFTQLNLRLYLRFMPVQKKKRIENKLVGGVLAMGAGPAPITEYSGPNNQSALELPNSNLVASTATKDSEPNCSGLEDKSSGNVNRDDRI
jgi:hypothetical protein